MKLIILAAVSAALITALPAMGATTLRVGSTGPYDTQLQQNLHANIQQDFYGGDIDGDFGPITRTALILWQRAQHFTPTGVISVGSRQWNLLAKQATVTRLPSYIDPRSIAAAQANGWAVDASKSPGEVTILQRVGKTVQIALSIAASYGDARGPAYVTHEGVFHIYAEMGYNFYSQEYGDAPMHYAACFSGGQCLHYDPLTVSHGCIHIPSMPAAKFIDGLPLGTAVVVHG